MLKVTLTDLFNLADFESHKNPQPDEILLKISTEIEGGKAVPKLEFTTPAEPQTPDKRTTER